MSRHAANPAALPHLSLCGLARAYETPQAQAIDCDSCLLAGPSASSVRAVMGMNFCSEDADENFGPVCVSRPVSRHLHGHCFGAYPAPCGSSLFCFGYAALRVTVSLRDPP
jgi:hypothetical protein